MTSPSRRLPFLLEQTSRAGADPFAWYGLALEYKQLGRVEDALATFQHLRASHPEYLPMYLMCGQMLAGAERLGEAKLWLAQGVALARAQGESHALRELEGALQQLSANEEL